MTKRINVIQIVISVVGLILTLLFPFYQLKAPILPGYGLTILRLSRFYQILFVPIICWGLLIVLSLMGKTISAVGGVITIIVLALFGLLRKSVVLNGDITFLLQTLTQLVNLLPQSLKDYVQPYLTMENIRTGVDLLLHVDIMYYVELLLAVLYSVAAVLTNGVIGSHGGKGSVRGGYSRF